MLGTTIARMENEQMSEFESGHELLTETVRHRLSRGSHGPGTLSCARAEDS